MRILSITAQKPNSTGSGVFLSELVKSYAAMGHEQAVIAGIAPGDAPVFPDGVRFCPVTFQTETLPFPVVGMSDEMPYLSTRYCDMTPEMVHQFETAFRKVLRELLAEWRPDVILCHHLYLLTAIVREEVTDIPVYGFCHNTDLRQMKKHGLERARIAAAIRRLDRIFVLRQDHVAEVEAVYAADPEKITPVGMGYNRQIFYEQPGARAGREESDARVRRDAPDTLPNREASGTRPLRLIYAGKLAEKKGVMSLIRSLSKLSLPKDALELVCAGGAGNEEEYRIIRELAEACPYPVSFPGRLDQKTLASYYNRSYIFVLPSFYEGIPLTVIEALACGCRVVLSDIPGVRDWLQEFVPEADIRYVTLPKLMNQDEPVPEELPAFEERLAKAIEESIAHPTGIKADVTRLSWERIAQMAL